MTVHSSRMRVLTIALTLCAIAAAAAAQTVNITIYHTSDLHEQSGNLARVAAYVKAQKASDPNVLLVDTGDWFNRGDAAMMFTRGEGMLAVLGAVGYDAVVFGNHDGSFTAVRLAELIDRFKIPLVSSNGVWPEGVAPKSAVPYKLFKLKGVTVGIVGGSTPGIGHNPTGDLRASNVIEAMKKIVPEVRKQADIVIAITHHGVGADAELAAAVPGIDAILGGHDHRHFRKAVPAAGGGKIPLQHDYAYCRALGQLILKYDPAAKRVAKYYQFVKKIEPAMPEDPAVKAVRDTYLAPWSDVLAKAPAEMNYRDFYAFLAQGVRDATGADAAVMIVPVPRRPKRYPDADAAELKDWQEWTPPPAVNAGDLTRGALLGPVVRWSVVTFDLPNLDALKTLVDSLQQNHESPMLIALPKDVQKDKPLKVAYPCVMYETPLNVKALGLQSEAVTNVHREIDRSLWHIASDYAAKVKTVSLPDATIIDYAPPVKEPEPAATE